MYDFIEELPDKTYIIEIPNDENLIINWELIQAFSQKVKVICSLRNILMNIFCKEYNIDFYWAYPITTWFELNNLIELGVSYLYLTAPLSMDLPQVRHKTDIPIRMCPNIAYDAYVPAKNGICGQWVRPEDVPKYEQYVSTFEFLGVDLARERTMHHVYEENGNWPGNLNLLIKNLDFDIDNRVIDDDLIKQRMECGQRCMRDGKCHLCEKAFGFYSAARTWYYKNAAKNP